MGITMVVQRRSVKGNMALGDGDAVKDGSGTTL